VNDPDRRRVEEICDAALDVAAGERDAFIARHCGRDRDLQREVEALLAHAATAHDFLDAPLDALAAQIETG
jgi:hypothetical protein